MMPGVRTVVDNSRRLEAALKALTSQEVLVGVPAEKAERQAVPEDGEFGPITNAQLLFIHEKGSPARNIPARPTIDPGVHKAKDPIADQLRAAGVAGLEGNTAGVNAALEKAGIIAQNSVRAQFVDGGLQPLAASTLAKRIGTVHGPDGKIIKRGKTRAESGAINPLILSGQLRKAITYVVRKKGS